MKKIFNKKLIKKQKIKTPNHFLFVTRSTNFLKIVSSSFFLKNVSREIL